jgi:hypothetical protein
MENAGWVRVGSHTGGGTHTYLNTSASNWGINRSGSTLTGRAWSETAGWMDVAPAGGGVSLNAQNGEFSGNAWSENLGWIRFAGTAVDNQSYQAAATAVLQSSGSKSNQTISFGATASTLTLGTSTTLVATASSGLPVTLTNLTVSACTLTGNTVQALAVGSCQIAANQTGNVAFNPAPQAVLIFNVSALHVGVPTLSFLSLWFLAACMAAAGLAHHVSRR